jgi:hypothetical protein
MATVAKMVWGYEVEVKVGTVVKLDARRISEALLPCEWEAADFRFPCWALRNNGITGVACKVEVTGRTLQRVDGRMGVRCTVEFVNDGEPSTFAKGWVIVI